MCAKFWALPGHLQLHKSSHPCRCLWVGADSRARHGWRPAAHWSSWADCLRMVKQRHPDLAATMIHELEHGQHPSFTAVRECRGALVEAGLDVPSWGDLSETLPEPLEDPEPNALEFGWQQRATRPLEAQFFQDSVWPFMEDPERALMRSQHGPLASAPLTALPTSRVMRLDAQP